MYEFSVGLCRSLWSVHPALKHSWEQKTLTLFGRDSSRHFGHCKLAGSAHLRALRLFGGSISHT
jgi:hypothetical protein